jgi:hypothetical protein
MYKNSVAMTSRNHQRKLALENPNDESITRDNQSERSGGQIVARNHQRKFALVDFLATS